MSGINIKYRNPSDVVIPVTELHFFERLGSGTSASVFRGYVYCQIEKQ